MSSVSSSLVSSFTFSICHRVFVFFLGDSVRSMLSGCLIKSIPTINKSIYLWNKTCISICYCLTLFPISSPKLIRLRCSGNSVIQSVCLTATLTCCAPGRLFLPRSNLLLSDVVINCLSLFYASMSSI